MYRDRPLIADDSEPVRSGCVMTAINSYERDIRALLDYMEKQYVSEDMKMVVRRLRRAVGYGQ